MITFNQKSGLVRIWGNKVLHGAAALEDVPHLGNLQEEVEKWVAAEKEKRAAEE